MSDKLPPAPWKYTYAGSSDWEVHDANGDHVATVWSRDDERAREAVFAICATPELLGALKQIYSLASDAGQIGAMIQDIAVMAIAKAVDGKGCWSGD